jgi:hypothetical protein
VYSSDQHEGGNLAVGFRENSGTESTKVWETVHFVGSKWATRLERCYLSIWASITKEWTLGDLWTTDIYSHSSEAGSPKWRHDGFSAQGGTASWFMGSHLCVLTWWTKPMTFQGPIYLFIHFIFWDKSHYLAQAVLEFKILLPQSPKCWNYRHVPPHPALGLLFIRALIPFTGAPPLWSNPPKGPLPNNITWGAGISANGLLREHMIHSQVLKQLSELAKNILWQSLLLPGCLVLSIFMVI